MWILQDQNLTKILGEICLYISITEDWFLRFKDRGRWRSFFSKYMDLYILTTGKVKNQMLMWVLLRLSEKSRDAPWSRKGSFLNLLFYESVTRNYRFWQSLKFGSEGICEIFLIPCVYTAFLFTETCQV